MQVVRFQGPTAAALGVMLSAQARGSTEEQRVASPPTLLEAMSADSLVPRSPEPVMDRAVANELPNAQMGACGVHHIPLPPLQSTQRCTYTHRRLWQPLKIKLGSFSIDAALGAQTYQNIQFLSEPVVYCLLNQIFGRFFHCNAWRSRGGCGSGGRPSHPLITRLLG